MNRLISFILLMIMLLCLLSACSDAHHSSIDTISITASSSDAEKYRDWLKTRLEGLSVDKSIIIGTGNSDTYGIDMTSFEDDGYVIRSLSDSTVIFGKTEAGLDLACRRFASDIDLNGKPADIVYHEGYRISELKLFGYNIREYTIVCDADSVDITNATEEFVRLVESACGAKLSVSDKAPASGKAIRFNLNGDSFSEGKGYSYFCENGNLVFEFANENDAVNAVHSFFENECGWYGLLLGRDCYLSESDTIDISPMIHKTTIPALDVISSEDVFFPAIITDGVCLSDDTVYEDFCTSAKEYANATDNTAVIGIKAYGTYCDCAACADILQEEGSTAGTAVRLANRFSADADDVDILIYTDDNCTKTAPKDNVSIIVGKPMPFKNDSNLCDSVLGWLSTTDNVYADICGYNDTLIQFYNTDALTSMIKELQSYGIKGLHTDICTDSSVHISVTSKLIHLINNNIGITQDELKTELDRILRHEYGDGWEFVKAYLSILGNSCSGETAYYSKLGFDTQLYSDNFDTSVSLIERSVALACSATTEQKCKALSLHMYYMGCLTSYFQAYHTADTDRIKILDDRYSLLAERMASLGISDSAAPDNLYDAAWHNWADLEDILYTGEKFGLAATDEFYDFCERVEKKTSDDSFTFVFRTDTHYTPINYDKTSMMQSNELFSRIDRYASIDLFVHGGDIINGKEQSADQAENRLADITGIMRGIHTKSPHFFLRGNHDDNSWYAYSNLGLGRYDYPADTILTNDGWIEHTLPDKACGIVLGGDGSYGYFDHEESKIRVLLLNSSDIPYEIDDDGNYKYGSYTSSGFRQEQLRFMADAMLFSDKGDEASEWAILVMSHIPPETSKAINYGYRFGGAEASGRNSLAFLRILKAYQLGSVFDEKQMMPTNHGDGGYTNEYADGKDSAGDFAYDIYADYSANGPGEVIGIICGHTHIDNYSDEVGKQSYSWYDKIYPELSYGYSYFSVSSKGAAVFTVDRNGDGTGEIFVDKFGTSVVTSKDMICDGDDAVATTDPVALGSITSVPHSGSIASGEYSVIYRQNK